MEYLIFQAWVALGTLVSAGLVAVAAVLEKRRHQEGQQHHG